MHFVCDKFFFFFSSRRRHTRLQGDWSSDVCSSDLEPRGAYRERVSRDDRGGGEPPRKGCAHEQDGEEARERRKQHEETKVVERTWKQAPDGREERCSREVREMVECHVRLRRLRPDVLVPTAQVGIAVVVPVRVVAVDDEIARKLDLV